MLPEARHVRSICCLLLGEIGDAIVCTPTLKALRTLYPSAHITLIARPIVVSLLAASQLTDAYLQFNAKRIWQKLGFLLRLHRQHYDLWVDLQAPTFNTFGSDDWIFQRNVLLMRCATSRYRLGFAVPKALPYLTHAVPVPSQEILRNENMVSTTLRLLALTPPTSPPAKQIGIADTDLEWADRWWQQHQLQGNRVLGLFFGAKQRAKFWPCENIGAFIKLWLEKNPNHCLVLLGGPHEQIEGKSVMDGLPSHLLPRAINTIGQTTLGQLGGVMQYCTVIVSTDSGPMHIADALSRPLVALMSYHNHPAVWRPVSARARSINHPVECGPCLRDVCPNHNECMRQISPSQVMQQVADLLSETN